MKALVVLLLTITAVSLSGALATEPSRPVWREDTRPLWKDDAWLWWPEQTRPLRDDRPLWKRMLSSVSIFADSQEVHGLPSSAGLSEKLHNYEIAVGVKITIFF